MKLTDAIEAARKRKEHYIFTKNGNYIADIHAHWDLEEMKDESWECLEFVKGNTLKELSKDIEYKRVDRFKHNFEVKAAHIVRGCCLLGCQSTTIDITNINGVVIIDKQGFMKFCEDENGKWQRVYIDDLSDANWFLVRENTNL